MQQVDPVTPSGVAASSDEVPAVPGVARRPRTGLLLAAPAIVLAAVFTVWPVVRIVLISLEGGGEGYSRLWSSVVFRSTLAATVQLATVVTLVCLVAAYPMAYLLTRVSRRTANVILGAVVLTFWISVLVRIYAWMAILGRRGVLNESLAAAGLIDEPTELLFSRFAVVIGMTHYLLPYMLLTLFAGMSGIDPHLMVAAKSLGASRWEAFRRVYFPLTKPAVFAGSMLVFVLSLGFFVVPAIMGGPQDTTIAVYIEQQVSQLRWGLAAAAAIVLLVPSLILFAVIDRSFGLDRLYGTVRN